MKIEFTKLDQGAQVPTQQHVHDAGYDLHANESVTLAPAGGRGIVPTGLAVAIPEGCAGLLIPRSGLALRHGVTCLNTPGLIDPLYRGELKVLLVNTDPSEPYTVQRGDRIAQLVITKVESQVEWHEVDELDETTRDTYGFGSTGR
ncbi:MAG: dUTP diphosphatase [Acidimicrobiia bacterium]